ncbi:MAG: polymer-forming cytoskeletal protein [Bacillota bacterium]|jgi:hypothetical protein
MNRLARRIWNNKNNNKGYVLVWTIVIILVMVVSISSVLTMSASYNTRSINNNLARQAYFTARSVASSLAYEMSGFNLSESGQTMLSFLTLDGASFTINDLQFEGNNGFMGKCSATVKREKLGEDDTILIIATATLGSETKSVATRLFHISSKGQTGLETVVIGGNTSVLYGFSTNPETDLFINVAGDSFTFEITANGNSPFLQRNLYSNVPIFFRNGYFANSHIHGSIISDQDINLSQYVTVGPYEDCCNGTVEDSEIYTTSKVSMVQQSRVYCPMTAQSVTADNETKIYNDITAETVNLKLNVVMEGNITANTVVLEGQAQVTGNVKADTIIMKSNAKIIGSVTTNTLTMTNDAKITGAVTVGTLNMNNQTEITGDVWAYSAILQAGSFISGNLTARSVTCPSTYKNPLITGTLKVENNITSNIKAGQILLGVPYTGSATPITATVLVTESKMPESPAAPIYPALADHQSEALVYNNVNTVLGNTDGSDSYYFVSGNMDVPMLKTQGEGNIFIYVKSGATLIVKEMQPERKEDPNVFVIVQDGGTFRRFNIEAESWMQKDQYKDFYGYIIGEEGSTVYIGRGTHIYGGLSAPNAGFGLDVMVTYRSLGAHEAGGSGGKGAYWTISGYENP